jgi:cytochrome c oxidase cbb3-type subunit IV
MDLNDLRSLATVASFAAFLGILAWAFSRRNQSGFDEAAQLPFAAESGTQTKNNGGTHE